MQDDLVFQYNTTDVGLKPSTAGFSIKLERREGRGGVKIDIDNPGPTAPMRFVVVYEWPPSLQHVKEVFDLASKAVFESLQGSWQRVMAEVRFRAQCDAESGDGLGFIRRHAVGFSSELVDSLGQPLVFGAVKLEVAQSGSVDDSLANPKREISVEALREDPHSVYIELMSQWAQFPQPAGASAAVDMTHLRKIEDEPSVYVEESYHFLTEKVLVLGSKEGRCQ
jgi:hypothetical protein